MAGSTNFLQHNPAAANQESDLVYIAESIRTGGIGIDEIVPSNWLNKILYQTSTGMAAFTQALANKGYVLSDANISTLTGVFSNVLTNADLKANVQNVSFASTISFNAAASNGFQVTLGGNATCNVVGGAAGQVVNFIFIQDAVGNRTVTFNNMFPGQVIQALNPVANSVSIVSLIIGLGGHLCNYAQEVLTIPYVQQGTGIGQGPNGVKLGWSGSRLKATIDVTDLGNVVFDTQLNPVSTVANNAASAIAAFKALFTGTLASPGFFKIGTNGGQEVYLQWGTTGIIPDGSGSGVTLTVNFPVSFPNACLSVVATDSFVSGSARIIGVTSFNQNSFNVHANGQLTTARWFAIGF